jgi:anti-sigma regulatory factor (Ser/Thr protein kinase)
VPEHAITLSIVSCPAHLPVVRAAVQKYCELIGFEDKCTDGIVMAVDEALANVIEHAYQNQSGKPIEVSIRALSHQGRQTGLEVELADLGQVVPPEAIHGRELGDIRPGGLGTHIMSTCLDTIEYSHPPQGGTHLRMVKYLPTGQISEQCEPTAGE